MWGTQGWNQWALQPAMFNDVPHEQIDWAALAKQWIQMQQAQPAEAGPSAPLPAASPGSAVPGPGPNILPPPPGHIPLIPDEFPEANVGVPLMKTPHPSGGMPETFHSERPFDSEPPGTFLPKPVDNAYWNKSQWEASAAGDIDERIWTAPPIEPAAPPPPPPAAPLIGGKETFDYGHMHDNPPLAMQSIDYNHMSDYSYNQVYAPPPENQYEQYWSQVNASPAISPMFLKKERINANLPVEEDTSQIDAAKRKQLPAWIRDGLEKMEQDRLKRLEKERAAKERAEKMAKAAVDHKDLDIKTESSAVVMPSKSKFESDSDAEDDEIIEKRSSPVVRSIPSPVEDLRTEEEKKQDMMLKVRRILTEILLTVTNSEMLAVAQEVYNKAMAKAPARQLASSSSLTSVATGLRGLASYGTESEASDVEEENGASDSEEELYRRIKEKKKLFALKEKKIVADLEKRELEERLESEKAKHENSGKNLNKELLNSEKIQHTDEVKLDNKITSTDISQSSMHSLNLLGEIPFLAQNAKETSVSSKEVQSANGTYTEVPKQKIEASDSSDTSSSSSESESESSEKHKKKYKEREVRKTKEGAEEISKKEKSTTRRDHHRRSRSRDSDSSDKHRKSHSYDKSTKSSSSRYKKKKKYKRSDSSSSSSSTSRKRKHSSKSESNHSYSRERRSHSYEDKDRKHRRSDSSSRSYRKSDSHSYRSSHDYKYEDRDKYDRRYKEDKRYRETKRSPSPYRHSSKLPKKYRSSRSPSSESGSSGKKLKKSRNR